jgi:hypothetical protein
MLTPIALIVLSMIVLAVGLFVYSLDRAPVPTYDDSTNPTILFDDATHDGDVQVADLTVHSDKFPRGWPPILITSLLFALAHFGYGPDPIAIFFLAIALGYVYRRTHRIVPCIVAHAMFNSLAMFVLWRFVFLHAE